MASSYPMSHQFACANTDQIIDGETVACAKIGSKACNGCYLVQYCGKECQLAHWKVHKADCRSPFIKRSWRPQWDVEKRRPAFIGASDDGAPGGVSMKEWVTMVQHGRKKYLWGNVPAIDMVQSSKNEGKEFPEQFNLLFAGKSESCEATRG